MEVEAIVAEIDDDGLLGVDILQNGKNGPADLLMSKGVSGGSRTTCAGGA